MQVRDKLYINGLWATPKGSKSINVINASTEEIMGRVPEGTEADVDAAVAAARAAFESWSATPAAERAGQVDINGAPFNLQAPFGGFRQSGNGRELGRFGLEEFLEYKSLQLKPQG